MPYRHLLLALFLLSGAAALMYEILWTRLLTLVFGSTTFAVSAALTSFMTGLALGAYFLGRLADRLPRPLRLYAALEAGIAAAALLLPQALDAISLLYPALYAAGREQAWLLPAVRLLLSFLILLIPCTLIGGTLPVLVRFAARAPERFGRDFGWLYGMNTLGAVIGSLLAGFYLMGRFGLATTNFTAVATNLFLALAFLALDARASALHSIPAVPPARNSPRSFTRQERIVIGVAVLSGVTVLGLEVLWTRALVHTLLSTTYSFTAMLGTLLLALALGSFLAARWPVAAGPGASTRLLRRLAQVELLLAAALLAELPLLGELVFLNDYYIWLVGPDWQVVAKFFTAAVVMLVPATLAGMLFPLTVQILGRRLEWVGGSLGQIYLLNTLAAAAGALLAGFGLIPGLGVKASYLGIAGLHAAVALGLGFYATRRRAWLLALVVLLALVPLGRGVLVRPDPFGDPRLQFPGMEMEMIAYRETADATFAIYEHRPTRFRFLYINGFVAAADERMSQYMPMMAHLPLLLHPAPKRVLVIAFGTGSTAGAASLHPIEQLDIVDISRAVYDLAPYFAAANHRVLSDPRARAWVEDGRNFVEATRTRYDVITSEPMPPKFATMVNFYTREYYQAARARLTERGVLCQWLPFHLVTPEDARMIVGTFREVFPHASLWIIRGTGLLIGTKEPLEITPAELPTRLAASPALSADLARLKFETVDDLLASFALDAATLERFSAGALLVTDNNPYLEFSADQPLWMPRGRLPIYDELNRLRRQSSPPLVPRPE
ncbi:MAG: fused MFS/spermidine synthase [Terriglobia bacterium]